MWSRFATVFVLSFAAVAVGGKACAEGEDSCRAIGDAMAMVQVKLSKASGHVQAEEANPTDPTKTYGWFWGGGGHMKQGSGCCSSTTCGVGTLKGWGIPFESCALSCIHDPSCKAFEFGQQRSDGYNRCTEPNACRCYHITECTGSFEHLGYNIYYRPGTVIKQFPGGGRSYSQSQQFCSSESLVLCPKGRICPSGHHNQPVGGSMHGDVWIPIADTVNDWVQIGNAWHVLCAGHSERGYGLPPWGLGHNPYNQRIYCCA